MREWRGNWFQRLSGRDDQSHLRETCVHRSGQRRRLRKTTIAAFKETQQWSLSPSHVHQLVERRFQPFTRLMMSNYWSFSHAVVTILAESQMEVTVPRRKPQQVELMTASLVKLIGTEKKEDLCWKTAVLSNMYEASHDSCLFTNVHKIQDLVATM